MNRATPVLGLSLILAAPALSAQVADADREADHQALRKLREEMVTAFNRLDMKAFRATFGPSFAFTGADQEFAASTEDLQAYHKKWFEGDDALLEKIEITAETDGQTHFTGADTGFAYGTAQCLYHLTDGTKIDIPARWTATLQRIDGEWKVITAHLGVNVLDNPVMTASVGFWKASAAGGLGGGFVLGLLLCMIRGRRKSHA